MEQSGTFQYVLDEEEFYYGGKTYRTGRAVKSGAAFIRDEFTFPPQEPVWPNADNPHMLPCMFGDHSSKFIYWEKFDRSFANRMERLKNSGIEPVMTYEVPRKRDSGFQKSTISYVPEVYRKYFRSMVRFLIHIHNLGFVTKGFQLWNIVLYKGKIKFFGLDFKKMDAGNNQQSEINADFGYLSDLIMEIYKGLEGALPWEFKQWVHDLYSYNRTLDGLILNHVATLTHHERLALVRELCERRFEHECLRRFHPTMRQASVELGNSSWTSKIKNDGSPIAYFFAKANQGDQIQPWQDRLLDLLRFSRNFIVHIGEDSGLFEPWGGITTEYKDIALFDSFGEHLYTIQLKASAPPENVTGSLLSWLDYSDEGVEVDESERDEKD